MARDPDDDEKMQKAHSVFVRLVLPPYTIHFKSPTYMKDTTLDLLDKRVCKETLKSTANQPGVRETIGKDRAFWSDLRTLFLAAIPSLERRSFTIWDPTSVDYESTSGALIASNYPGLWKDLERLNDLVSIARNVLTIGPAAQDVAADCHIDSDVFRLVNCCVRVTARGYDGEAGTGEEEKWQWIVNAYKKLLITSLQFLNNLVAQNERRKVQLWLQLFDQQTAGDAETQLAPEDIPETARTSLADVPSNPSSKPEPPITAHDLLVAFGTDGVRSISQAEHDAAVPCIPHQEQMPPGFRHAVDTFLATGDASGIVGNAYVYFGKQTHDLCVQYYQAELHRDPTLAEEHQELMRRWAELGRNGAVSYWVGLWEDVCARYRNDMVVWEAKDMLRRSAVEKSIRHLERRGHAGKQGIQLAIHVMPLMSLDDPALEEVPEQYRELVNREWRLFPFFDPHDTMSDVVRKVESKLRKAANYDWDGWEIEGRVQGASGADMGGRYTLAEWYEVERPADRILFMHQQRRDPNMGPDEPRRRGRNLDSIERAALREIAGEWEKEVEEHLTRGISEEDAALYEDEEAGQERSLIAAKDLHARPIMLEDLKATFGAKAGARILESGKIELMKRLSDYEPPEGEEDVDELARESVPAEERTGDDVILGRDAHGNFLYGNSGSARSATRSQSPEERRVKEGQGVLVKAPDAARYQLSEHARNQLIAERERLEARREADSNAAVAGAEDELEEDVEGEELEGSQEDEVEGEEDEEEDEEEEEEEDDDDDDEDEDYPGSTEDGRGLLTDVPLILGPSEIEVLPMLIMSGIVPSPTTSSSSSPEESRQQQDLCFARTHLLLSSPSGRNLLRELLIFVAAWDLREEELYFKFMIKILEAILQAGLLPYAYHGFRDRSRSKDIISPAQAVVLKLLTGVWRGKFAEGRTTSITHHRVTDERRLKEAKELLDTPVDEVEGLRNPTLATERLRALMLAHPPPSRVELHTLNFLFMEFRQHIIPQTCALIFLQSQIHRGKASPEDFPLNLWDMERMYEGVYQFLEFFAVLCEDGGGKGKGGEGGGGEVAGSWGKAVLAEWEASSELVALLRELEGGGEKAVGRGYGKGGVGAGVGVGVGGPQQQQVVRRGSQQPPPPQPHAGVGDHGVQESVLPSSSSAPAPQQQQQQRSLSADAAIPASQTLLPQIVQHGAEQGVAVERPLDVEDLEPTTTTLPPLPSLHPPPTTTTAAAAQSPSIFEAETPLAYPEDPAISTATAIPPLSAALAAVHQHATLPPPLHPASTAPAGVSGADQDEPSDFEWRNLKKLTVLVLSSLVWKNKKVQDQLRKYGGLEALVGCCRPDENNPYIREHAIMCLRFAVEGNKENGEVIRGMARERQEVRLQQQQGGKVKGQVAAAAVGRGEEKSSSSSSSSLTVLPGGSVTLEPMTGGMGLGMGLGLEGEEVPREVLESGGYETFVDGKGQVGLRRKDGQPSSTPSSSSAQTYPPPTATAAGPSAVHATATPTTLPSIPSSSAAAAGISKPAAPPRLSPAKITAEKAAELMQSALRDLPLGDKLVTDRQKAEALAKLDRAFESTERALGRGGGLLGGVVGGKRAGGRGGGGSGGGGNGGA